MRIAWNKTSDITKDERGCTVSFLRMDYYLSDLSIILKSFSQSTVSWGSIPPISAKSFWLAFFSGSLPRSVFAESSASREQEREEDNALFFAILFSRLKNIVIFKTHCSVETIKKDNLPDRVCVSLKVFELDIVPQLDASRRPITVTKGLWLFCRAAFRGVAWLNWTEDKQPINPLNPAWTSSLSVMSIPETGKRIERLNLNVMCVIFTC